MQVSVITPVYNAASFVRRAVESALQQPEIAEVLLIEDGSPDNSLEVCQQLADQDPRVKLLRHPKGENRGAGASRNLGMRNASCEFIAFVDADNYYLPGRFTAAKNIFAIHPECEGVYENIGMHVEDEESLQRWIKSKKAVTELTGLAASVAPEQLTEALIEGRMGSLTLDGLTLKRSVLEKSGYMAESLRLHQDTEWIIRVTSVARLIAGRLTVPVAMRGVHDHNRISASRSISQVYQERMLFWLTLYHWFKQKSDIGMERKILKAIVKFTKSCGMFDHNTIKSMPETLVLLFRLTRLTKYPEIVIDLLRQPPISSLGL